MTDNEIMSMLPEEAPPGLISWTTNNYMDELGDNLMIYSRTSSKTIEDVDSPFIEKSHWITSCICTACGSEMIAGYAPKDVYRSPGMIFLDNLDGTVVPGDWNREDLSAIEIRDGDTIICPYCEEQLRACHKKNIINGRTQSLMVGQLTSIDKYTAVIYWLIHSSIDEYGRLDYAEPAEAIVLTERKLLRFSHLKTGGYGIMYGSGKWEQRKSLTDPEEKLYYSWESCSRRKQGAVMWDESLQDQTGKTGEKSGIKEYLTAGGQLAFKYFKLWLKHPGIETIAKTGFSRFIYKELASNGDFNWINWAETKPYRMIGTANRAEFKFIAEHGDFVCYKCWREYTKLVESVSYQQWLAWEKEMNDTYRLTSLSVGKGIKLSGLLPYLRKQQDYRNINTAALAYVDYIDSLDEILQITGETELTNEQLRPKNLRVAHDRALEQVKSAETCQYDASFKAFYERHKDLEWNDGDLSIVIPKTGIELVKEGETLKHCVGGYCEEHVSGQPVFFVRHYRRPERSYYTLNEDLTKDEPSRIQLHGYGNERHGDHKQYSHRIPQKVLDFVTRWEEEVLKPWCILNKKKDRRRKAA